MGQGLLVTGVKSCLPSTVKVVAQVLLTRKDLRSRERYVVPRHTLLEALRYQWYP